MVIREATRDDVVSLINLLAQLGYAWSVPTMQARLEAFQHNRDHIMVMEHEQRVIAVIAFGYFEQLRVGGSCCHIDTLVVDKAYRGQGLGKQLIAFVEAHAHTLNAESIALITANHRKAGGTHAFYEALDYKNNQALDLVYFAKENMNNDKP